jgi:hypothetical protein
MSLSNQKRASISYLEREGEGGESKRESEIGKVRSKLGTAAGNFISGKRDRLVKVRLA